MEIHKKNFEKQGNDTNLAIINALGKKPLKSEKLNRQYMDFCKSLGLEPLNMSPLGFERKFWKMQP